MAKFEIKFFDYYFDKSLSVEKCKATISGETKELIHINIFFDKDNYQSIYLDKSTAIKFAKTLRTEINKIQ